MKTSFRISTSPGSPNNVSVPLRRGAGLLLAALIAAHADAQVALQHFDGDPNGNHPNRFGYSVASIGDVDNDGLGDFVVSAPFYVTGDCWGNLKYEHGSASVVSGKGVPIRTHAGKDHGCYPYYNPLGGSRLGISVAALGDIDGDGMGDYIIGEDRNDPGGKDSGSATVYSGVDGAPVVTLNGTASSDYFGRWVSAAGDTDKDGVTDILVGAPYENQPLRSNCGSVRLISGASPHATITTFFGISTGAEMGVCGRIGDVNGDGHDDVLTGAHLENSGTLFKNGRVTVFSGTTPHQPLLVFEGTADNEELGYRVAGAGDLNLDGLPDTLATSKGTRVVHVFDSFGATLRSISAPANSVQFGDSLAGAGDVDGDGRGDFLVGDPGFNGGAGIVYVYSLRPNGTLRLISTLPGYGSESGGKFGFAVSSVGHWETATASWVGGDWNGDERDDVVVGATNEYSNRGRAHVFSGVCLEPTNYCTSNVNSSGKAARIGYDGSLSIANDDFVLTAQDCPPNKTAIFYYGPLQIQAPFGCGLKCVGGNTYRLPPTLLTDSVGSTSQTINYGANTSIVPGATWNFQLWFRDGPGCPIKGTNLTDGLSGTFCP
jgi:hypothetical protein